MRNNGGAREVRRFCNPKPTQFGRIGHPAPLERRLVRCAGVTFEDRFEGKKWTLRLYEAYRDEWPEVTVWTVQHLMPVSRQGRSLNQSVAYDSQVKIEEADVPAEVKEFALATLVQFRLRGRVHA